MTIALDIRDYTCGIKRGIYFYALGLFQALNEFDKTNQYLGIEGYPLKQWRDKNQLFQKIWDAAILPAFIASKNMDILHFTSPNETDFNLRRVAAFGRCKTITTIHDIIPFLFPQQLLDPLPQNIRLTFEAQFQMALEADHLIAISQATKDDLIKLFNIDPKRISVVYQCNHDDRFRPRTKEEIQFIYDKYNLPQNFILNPSGKDFHKNFDNIVTAFSLLPPEIKQKYPLVSQGYFPKEELQRRKELCQKLNAESQVILTDCEPRDLPMFYNAATLTLAASLYEGFGLSPLESFTSGTPVIAGNTSSQPEVCENAAILVNPYDTQQIAEALIRVISDLALRNNLIEEGFKQAKKFSQERRAKETVEIYQKVFES